MFVNALDEALRTKRPGRKPRRARRRIEDIAKRRLQQVERMAREQKRVIAAGGGFDDPKFVIAFNETTKTMTNLLSEVRQGYEAERKAFGGLTEEQLDQVFVAQLARMAPKLDDHEKRLMLAIWFGEAIADLLLAYREPEPEVTP